MLERIAKEIAFAGRFQKDTCKDAEEFWDLCTSAMRRTYAIQASAALGAMLAPTDEMIDAGCSTGHHDNPTTYYQAMIKAAQDSAS